MLRVRDKGVVDFGCTHGIFESEALDEVTDSGVCGNLSRLAIDDDKHVKVYGGMIFAWFRANEVASKELWMRQAAMGVMMLMGLMLVGCSRPQQEYSRASPEAVVESSVLMVQRNEAERLTELVFAENIQMRSLLNQIGLMLGSMEELADVIAEKFPEELKTMRERIEAGGGKSIIEQITSSAGRRGGPGGGEQFREIAKRIFSDPYGWLERYSDKLDVIYLADDSYGVMYDGQVLLQPWGLLIQKQEDGWYLMLPTNLPGARSILPDTDDEYMIWGSLFKTIENGVRDMTNDVKRGRTTSMNQLGQSAVEKFAIPAVMVGYAYGKYREEEMKEQRAARRAEEAAKAEAEAAGGEQSPVAPGEGG